MIKWKIAQRSAMIVEIVAKAASEGWKIRPPSLSVSPIMARDGRVVGFYCPHSAGRGRTRVGPIYVLPEFRGRGFAEQAYSWAGCVPLMAYVHDNNPASERLHKRCGFVPWYKVRGGQFWRRG